MIDAASTMFETTEELLFRALPLWKIMETPLRKKNFQSWDTLYEVSYAIYTSNEYESLDDGIDNFLDIISRKSLLSDLEVGFLVFVFVFGWYCTWIESRKLSAKGYVVVCLCVCVCVY